MSYLGRVTNKSSDIRRIEVSSSTSATHTLTWTAPNVESLIVTINGITQQNNYTVSGTTLTLDTALISTDVMQVVGINDIGTTITPAQNSITNDMVSSSAAIAQSKLATLAIDTAELADDAVTTDKLANSINTEIAANTAKVTNATHTGDVTGATALTIAVDAVDIAMLSATGTASSSTFLRGDNAWEAAGGGKVLQVVTATYATQETTTSTSYVDTGLTASITPAATANKVLVLVSNSVKSGRNFTGESSWQADAEFIVKRGVTEIYEAPVAGDIGTTTNASSIMLELPLTITILDSPSTTSATAYTFAYRTTRTDFDVYSCFGNRIATITLLEIEG